VTGSTVGSASGDVIAGKYLDEPALRRLRAGQQLQMNHYGDRRLPFGCLGASGVVQDFVELDGPAAGRCFEVIDASGGYASACLGAGSEVATRALQRAVGEVGYVTDELVSGERSELLLQLFGPDGLWSETFPGSEYHVSGRNSGSEGLELALRLVLESRFDRRRLRPSAGAGKRDTILAFEGAWHGWTSGLLPAMNRRHYRIGLPATAEAGDYGVRVEHLPFGRPEVFEEFLARAGDRLLAVLIEPIQGDAGILQPPAGYLRRVADLTARSGAFLIADEVLTFAKTGAFFAMADEQGPIPTDVTVIGKSLGMGVLSTSMVIARRGLTIRSSGAVATSDLRPVTCAVIRDGIGHLVETGLVRRAAELGQLLTDRLRDVVRAFPQVYSEVRGVGVMQGVELTEQAAGLLPALRDQLIRAGVYVEFMAGAGRRSDGLRYVYPTMRIAPPLIIQPAEVAALIDRIRAGTAAFQASA
jgi:acetylornithine/succinyldiaminopimelate/putrescine aminotransferase